MTELYSQINYEKHFLVNNLPVPHEMCSIIKDYLFYNVKMSKEITSVRFAKMKICKYFEENMRFYDSVCCYVCGNFQLIMNQTDVIAHISNINSKIKCSCGEYSMWLPHGPIT